MKQRLAPRDYHPIQQLLPLLQKGQHGPLGNRGHRPQHQTAIKAKRANKITALGKHDRGDMGRKVDQADFLQTTNAHMQKILVT